MRHVLALSLQRDDGSAELTVEVKGDCWAGRGSAWFNTAMLTQFAADLEVMPLSGSPQPSISGGYWNLDATKLVQEHVHISVRPLDQVGSLVMRIKSFVPASNPAYAEMGFGCGFIGDFLVEYESLAQVSRGIRDLIAGTGEGVIEIELASMVAL